MNLKQNLFKLIYLFVLTFFSLSLGAKPFPKSFHTEYQLYQEKNILGEVLVNFRKKNNQYVINAKTNTEGIMKLLGDREIISQGKVSSNGFSPQVFKIKNKKKSKKNISALFDSKKKELKINYKGNIDTYLLKKNQLDLLTYLYQFNFESLNKKNYKFDIIDGKKSHTYFYKKVRQEIITTPKGELEADVYEGKIIEKKNSEHMLWILRKPYRFPIKIELKTKIGININQVLVETNLF
tara:strand:- start:60 stop:773 length:714 start_codon:yes stop_codon:yes gene_type:complete